MAIIAWSRRLRYRRGHALPPRGVAPIRLVTMLSGPAGAFLPESVELADDPPGVVLGRVRASNHIVGDGHVRGDSALNGLDDDCWTTCRAGCSWSSGAASADSGVTRSANASLGNSRTGPILSKRAEFARGESLLFDLPDEIELLRSQGRERRCTETTRVPATVMRPVPDREPPRGARAGPPRPRSVVRAPKEHQCRTVTRMCRERRFLTSCSPPSAAHHDRPGPQQSFRGRSGTRVARYTVRDRGGIGLGALQ